MVVWCLFDTETGSYSSVLREREIEHYRIGLGSGSGFLKVDLSSTVDVVDSSYNILEILESLPSPDIILASPPCESWSIASCFRANGRSGNNSYIFNSGFAIRPRVDIEDINERIGSKGIKRDYEKVVGRRINGEACAWNVLRIISHFKPKVWIIENPMTSKIFDYYVDVHNFIGIKNKTKYKAYDDSFRVKPTVFYSNIELKLADTRKKNTVSWQKDKVRGYGERSKIPKELVEDIINQCTEYILR